jgi:hypothetical protein
MFIVNIAVFISNLYGDVRAFFRYYFFLRAPKCPGSYPRLVSNAVHVSNKQVHHQEVISVHEACSISHASLGCLAANTM